MRLLTRREQVLIGLCALVLAAVGLPQASRLWSAPAPAGAATLSRRQAELERRVGSLQDSVAALTTTREQTVPRALALVQRAAAKAGAQVELARPLRDMRTGALTRHAVQFTVTGSFPQVVDLLAALASEKTSLVVERVEISAADEASDRVQAQLRVAGYEPAPTPAQQSRRSP